MRREFKVGDIYEDCNYHPVVSTLVDYDNDNIEGVSMIDGTSPRSCSFRNCNVKKLTKHEAEKIIAIYNESGERGLMRYHGWKDKEVDTFMKKWR